MLVLISKLHLVLKLLIGLNEVEHTLFVSNHPCKQPGKSIVKLILLPNHVEGFGLIQARIEVLVLELSLQICEVFVKFLGALEHLFRALLNLFRVLFDLSLESLNLELWIDSEVMLAELGP